MDPDGPRWPPSCLGSLPALRERTHACLASPCGWSPMRRRCSRLVAHCTAGKRSHRLALALLLLLGACAVQNRARRLYGEQRSLVHARCSCRLGTREPRCTPTDLRTRICMKSARAGVRCMLTLLTLFVTDSARTIDRAPRWSGAGDLPPGSEPDPAAAASARERAPVMNCCVLAAFHATGSKPSSSSLASHVGSITMRLISAASLSTTGPEASRRARRPAQPAHVDLRIAEFGEVGTSGYEGKRAALATARGL